MSDATPTDAIEWARLSTQNIARVASADGTRQGYVAERLQAWVDHPDWRLERLETECFGYTAQDDSPDHPDPDWDDDDPEDLG